MSRTEPEPSTSPEQPPFGSSNRFFRRLLLLAAVGLAALLVWHWVDDGQPSYQGRPLHSWLNEFGAPTWGTNPEAQAAMQTMGTNAIPYLVKDLLAQDAAWRIRARQKFRSPRFAWLHESPAQFKRSRAARALSALGDDAAFALPFLIEDIKSSADGSSMGWWGLAALVAPVPETIPAVIQGLDEPRYRRQSARFVGVYATNAAVALPFLLESAENPDPWIRYYALIGFTRLGPEAAEAEPIVRQLLDDPAPYIAQQAATALENIHPEPQANSNR